MDITYKIIIVGVILILMLLIWILSEIVHLSHFLKHKIHIIMQDLTALQAAVAAEDTVIDSAVTLINGLAEQIKNLPVGDQAAIDALAADVKSKSDALAAAVSANTPAQE